MNHQYLTFKIFPDKASAEDFSEVLEQCGIEYYIEEDALVFDPSYANNPLNKDYAIKIKQSDFKTASGAYDEYFEKRVSQVPEDYYLFTFNNVELEEILTRPDEWGGLDYQLAKELLKQRGVDVSKEKLDRLRAERYKELAKPKNETISNIAGYYFISILFFPIGIVIGWIWGYSKKLLPDGKKVFAYNNRVQTHGRNIFLISLILFGLTVIWKLLDRG
jgi:hypothetical protein